MPGVLLAGFNNVPCSLTKYGNENMLTYVFSPSTILSQSTCSNYVDVVKGKEGLKRLSYSASDALRDRIIQGTLR